MHTKYLPERDQHFYPQTILLPLLLELPQRYLDTNHLETAPTENKRNITITQVIRPFMSHNEIFDILSSYQIYWLLFD